MFSEENMVTAEVNMQSFHKNDINSEGNIICGFVTDIKSISYVAMKFKLSTKALL